MYFLIKSMIFFLILDSCFSFLCFFCFLFLNDFILLLRYYFRGKLCSRCGGKLQNNYIWATKKTAEGRNKMKMKKKTHTFELYDATRKPTPSFDICVKLLGGLFFRILKLLTYMQKHIIIWAFFSVYLYLLYYKFHYCNIIYFIMTGMAKKQKRELENSRGFKFFRHSFTTIEMY